ncbi:TPA: helix-turn-helix domain-containing protein [Candidatus Poribacteria bacterium]|nr:helix-turn-helix domain-containing protein [Candidatus Poribacteria bacterium]
MFGYRCQECGKGIVKPTKMHHYPTKFAGYPFIVPEAIIGKCELCGAKHFSASERKRWKKLFQESLESRGELLTPQEIRSLRKQLGLEMKDFALLIGCTLQSLSNWENPSRRKPQHRMADLMMRLLRASLQKGEIDVLKFLLIHVKKMDVELKIRSPEFVNGAENMTINV